MKSFQNILLLAFIWAIIGLSSCEKVDDPFEGIDQGGPSGPIDTGVVDTSIKINADTLWGDTGNMTIRKMLIEEITGHTCGNCPAKTKVINGWIDTDHKGKINGIAIHATSFANPVGKYTADFRTAKGTEFNQKFSNTDAPVALYNRAQLPGLPTLLVSSSLLESEFNKLVTNGIFDNPTVHLRVQNVYDKDKAENRLYVTAKALKALSGTHTLIIQIIEDNVISDQKDYAIGGDFHITDYTHRHMFRDALGSMDGNAFIDNGLAVGESISKSFSYKLDAAWEHKNCRFVISVRDNASGEIIQTDEVHAVKE